MEIPVNDPIPQIIYNCLSNFAYQDAIFLSERLHSESQTEESLYLLALCYYRAQKILKTYYLLKNRYLSLPQSKYLLSKCCVDLNKYGEAETILTECTLSKQKLYEEILKEYGQYSCFVLQILANVYSKTDRIPQAIEFHKKSLRINPFLWSSFEALCNFGERIDLNKYFTTSSAISMYNCQLKSGSSEILDQGSFINQANEKSKLSNVSTADNSLSDLFSIKDCTVDSDEIHNFNCSTLSVLSSNSCSGMISNNVSINFPQSVSENQADTTNFQNDTIKNLEEESLATPPQLISTNAGQLVVPKKSFSKRLPVKPLCGQNTGNLVNIALSNSHLQTVRRSSRIFAQNANAVKENKKLPNSSGSKGGITNSSCVPKNEMNIKTNKKLKLKKKIEVSKSESSTTLISQNALNYLSASKEINTKLGMKSSTENLCNHTDSQNDSSCLNYLNRKPKSFELPEEFQKTRLESLTKILRDFGYGYLNLAQYECSKAVYYFESLPLSHYQTSFVLSAVGKALFELHDYHKAEKVYLQLRQLHPYHLEGLEYYSTVLWHLQREISLSSLAQELTEHDKLAPETWCVVGNCFSLHKEHDAAIKFFQRATQINPNFVYAYNLLGHEYFLIEEMEKGLSCFRKAIFLDPRHYNAWYGISMINLKQEKFILAEKYLKKALCINPYSSTLMCHIAVVYHSMKKSDKALQILEKALELEPKNFLCKFHRASILFALGKYELALKDFEKLRRQIPKESLIYYMISKTHKKLKNIQLSLMFMSWAMDLDPRGVNNQLKENIDKRYVADNDSTFARELDSINTLTLESIYGSDIDQNDLNYENKNELINQIANEDAGNNDIPKTQIINQTDKNEDTSSTANVNRLSSLLSGHHISGTSKSGDDTQLLFSTSAINESTNEKNFNTSKTRINNNQQDHQLNCNYNIDAPLDGHNTHIDDQLMDLVDDTER